MSKAKERRKQIQELNVAEANRELKDLRMKLFMLKPEDQASLVELRSLYPNGVESTYHSKYPGKDFILFLTPPQNTATSAK